MSDWHGTFVTIDAEVVPIEPPRSVEKHIKYLRQTQNGS